MAKQADRAKARPVGAVAGQPAGLFVGLTTLDMIYLVRRPPGPDEKIVADDLVVAAGGPATGAAFAHLGGRATLVSAVGSGPLAAAARADLATLGIHHHDLRPGVPVLRFRQSWSTRRAGSGRWCRRTARCRAPCRALLAGADVVLVDGHQLDVAVNILGTRRSRPTGAGGAATSAGRPPVVFDDGSWKPRTERLLPHVDVALCGSAFRPPGVGVDPGEVLRYLLAHGPSFAAVTHGPGPVRWATARAGGEVLPPAVRAVDTLGAGDVFHGAFAWSIAALPRLTTAGLVDALAAASRVAARSVTSFGTRSWLTAQDEAPPSETSGS